MPVCCTNTELVCSTACVDGDVRLVGGNSIFEGRVEICVGAVWGTVCDRLWTDSDGDVACKQAGFSQTGAQTLNDAFFGPGRGPIHLGGLQCAGTEGILTECRNGSVDGCTHNNDAAVVCQPSELDCHQEPPPFDYTLVY